MKENEKDNFMEPLKIKIEMINKINKASEKTIIKTDKKERFYFFDNFRGILIFTTVFAHFLIYSNNNKNSVTRIILLSYFLL